MDAVVFILIWGCATGCLLAVFGRRQWRDPSASFRTYVLVSWALVALGILQVVVAPIRYHELSEAALWFGAAGYAVALTGVFNVLNLRRRLQDLDLKRVSGGANIIVTILFVAIATHRGAESLHDPVSGILVALGVTATTLCLRRKPVIEA